MGKSCFLSTCVPETRCWGDWLITSASSAGGCFGVNLNRRTEDNARSAGLQLIDVRRNGIWREIVMRPPGAEE